MLSFGGWSFWIFAYLSMCTAFMNLKTRDLDTQIPPFFFLPIAGRCDLDDLSMAAYDSYGIPFPLTTTIACTWPQPQLGQPAFLIRLEACH